MDDWDLERAMNMVREAGFVVCRKEPVAWACVTDDGKVRMVDTTHEMAVYHQKWLSLNRTVNPSDFQITFSDKELKPKLVKGVQTVIVPLYRIQEDKP